jgi:glucose-1-phosphate thymidylyltransferase
MSISEAVVLAAGEGRRLRPLTWYQPKPMLPVANRPLIDYVLDALLEAGIDRIVVVVGHRSNRLQSHLTERYSDARLEYVHQQRQLGSGHALQQAAGRVREEFVVVNGDNVVDAATVRATIDAYERSDAPAAVAVTRTETPEEYGVVTTTASGRIDDIVEQPSETDRYLINAGVYVFNRDVFGALERVGPRDGEISLTDAVVELSAVATQVEGLWLDPSNPWKLLSATERLLSEADGTRGSGSCQEVSDSATVHDTAVVEGAVLIGEGCEVDAGAVIRDGVCLQDNARVGPNAVVERSIVASDARIGAGAVIRDSIVGEGAHLGDSTVAPGGPADLVIDGSLYTERQVGSVVADRADVGANVTLAPGSRIGPTATLRDGVTVRTDIGEGAEVFN